MEKLLTYLRQSRDYPNSPTAVVSGHAWHEAEALRLETLRRRLDDDAFRRSERGHRVAFEATCARFEAEVPMPPAKRHVRPEDVRCIACEHQPPVANPLTDGWSWTNDNPRDWAALCPACDAHIKTELAKRT
jgi:hypothetical protein